LFTRTDKHPHTSEHTRVTAIPIAHHGFDLILFAHSNV